MADKIAWIDSEGDPVHLRVIYAEEAGGGYREATPADLAAVGYIKGRSIITHWLVHAGSALFIAYLLCELVKR